MSTITLAECATGPLLALQGLLLYTRTGRDFAGLEQLIDVVEI